MKQRGSGLFPALHVCIDQFIEKNGLDPVEDAEEIKNYSESLFEEFCKA